MRSLRYRLVVWHASVFAVGLLGFAGLIWFGAKRTLDTEIERWLGTQAEGLDRFLHLELKGTGEAAVVEEAREFSSGLPQGSGIQLFRADGTLLLSRPEAAPVKVTSEANWTAESGGRRTRWIARPMTIDRETYRFALWRTYDEADATLGQLAKLLAGLIPVFLLLSIAGGGWLSRRTLQPIDDLTRAARAVSLSKLSDRLALPESRDELYRLCEAWNEMLTRLEESAGRLKQFTADASHELRTPVAVIRAAAELALRQEREPAAYRQALLQIQEASLEMSGLIESLLALARAENEQIRASFTGVEMGGLVREVYRMERPRAEALALDFEMICPEAKAVIRGDSELVRRLLLILTDNALKFTPAPGKVALKLECQGQAVSVAVADSGIGMEPEVVPKIYERFFQADPSRSVAGAGLGLSLARWIAASHGAGIDVDTAPGRGSTFRVTFPRVLQNGSHD